ncbi:glycosyltransferase family 2 protein [Pseudidiomarina gelatinasegens]|uniref:glycosyltransferase family 2 protein n=1 Tax=Pseudidiomarina gelatinasegens TaxID=2487740 RepID=UPI0030EDCC58|tara:strand:- start:2014 stop:2898 length:885 start_codon:yes stop_codon:yes gene_type:complete
MKVLFVVPTYNDWERLEVLLLSFYRALKENKKRSEVSRNEYEICVVDNGSTTKTDLPKRFSEVIWLQEFNAGSYAARNKALFSQIADFYYFTDSDCIIDINFLSILDRLLESTSGVEIIGGKVELFPKVFGKETMFEAYDLITGLDQERYISKGTAITANLLVPKNVIERIGGFDITRFSGGDADFAQRAVKAGIKLEFNRELLVFHPARSNFIDFSKKVKRITGAQVQRLGLIKSWLLVPFYFLLLARDWRRTVLSKYTSLLKAKALCTSVVIFIVRQKYALYFLLGGKSRQR